MLEQEQSINNVDDLLRKLHNHEPGLVDLIYKMYRDENICSKDEWIKKI